MSHTVKIYDTCIGCTQCVRACPTDVLEMVPWDGCRAGQIASAPRTSAVTGRCSNQKTIVFNYLRLRLELKSSLFLKTCGG